MSISRNFLGWPVIWVPFVFSNLFNFVGVYGDMPGQGEHSIGVGVFGAREESFYAEPEGRFAGNMNPCRGPAHNLP